MELMNLCNTNNYNNAIIAEKIKKECMRQNITIKTMLQELSIGKDTVQQMYKYDKTPNYKSIARICDYLNISVDALLERPAPPNAAADINAAVECIARARGVSSDYVRGVLRLPPNGSSSTNNDI